jgi:hypothetical protein
MPMMDLCDVLLPKKYLAVFHEDNTSMIAVVRSGRNPTMRHLGRTHRISVQWLHEQLGEPNRLVPAGDKKGNFAASKVSLVHTDTNRMAADIYTKAFTDPDKWWKVCKLINVIDPRQLIQVVEGYAQAWNVPIGQRILSVMRQEKWSPVKMKLQVCKN